MSEQLKDKCPICGSYLFSDDDLVHCPECGAAHHRDCWQAVGHCGRLELHGKEPEKEEAAEPEIKINSCPKCGKELPEDAVFCPWCGDNESFGEQNDDEPFKVFSLGGMPQIKIDPMGGVKKDEEIDGVPAADIAKFIAYNPHRILPMFKEIHKGIKPHRWNWVAFISPYSHALFRKMNMHFIVYLFLEIIAYMLLTPFYKVMSNSMAVSAQELLNSGAAAEIFANPIVLVSTLLSLAFLIIPRIFAALNCEKHYKSHVIKTIKAIRADMDLDDEYEFVKKGRVRPFLSFFVFMLFCNFGGYIPALCLDMMIF